MLLVGAGLVTRGIAHAMAFNPGFDAEGIVRVVASLPPDSAADEHGQFASRLLAELEREMVEPVAAAAHGPFGEAPLVMDVALPPENAGQSRPALRRSVSRRYFDVIGIPLVKGRMFESGATGQVVVNETFARAPRACRVDPTVTLRQD